MLCSSLHAPLLAQADVSVFVTKRDHKYRALARRVFIIFFHARYNEIQPKRDLALYIPIDCDSRPAPGVPPPGRGELYRGAVV